MDTEFQLFVIKSRRAAELKKKLGRELQTLDWAELHSRDERFLQGLVFWEYDATMVPALKEIFLHNPALQLVVFQTEPIPPVAMLQLFQHGITEILSLRDADEAWQMLIERFSQVGGEPLLGYYHRLLNRFREVGIVTQHPEMAKIFAIVEKVAEANSSVLIQGESGTGKELIARGIHHFSKRRPHHFVPVNTGAIPETLLEDELFGHVKGAFTSAVKDRKGKFEYAAGGTIFLDEISTMSPALQVKLLRVLQEREIERVGDNLLVKVDVRVLSATNRNLEELVKNGQFREDLFYRLNVIPIHLPPLRQRKSDIPLLANYFIHKYCQQQQIPVKTFVLPALRILQGYSWPGNIRELENLVERMLVLQADKKVLLPQDLPEEIKGEARSAGSAGMVPEEIPEEGVSLNDIVENIERTLILKSLDKSEWNKQKAARLLGIKRTTLIEKIKKIQR